MKTLFVTIILLILGFSPALADTPRQESYTRLGVGVANSAIDSIAEVKSVSLGYAEKLDFGLRQQFEIQGWMDSRNDLGRKSGAMTSYSIGVDVNPGYFYFSTYVGVGVKVPNDALLGHWFQFVETFSAGVRDNSGKSFGLFYSHISNAGLFSGPNVGRDFIGVKLSVPY